MEFKKDLGWKACYDEERNIYTAEMSWRGYYQLCEITKEIYDVLGTDAMGDETAEKWISKGRELFNSDDDYYTLPYYVVVDERYAELAPWSDAIRRAGAIDEYKKKREEEEAASQEREKKLAELAPLFKAVLDADRAPVVLCWLDHEIAYMNPAAIERYAKRGGAELIGRSLLDCHNEQSKKKISDVLDWFILSNDNNIVYTFRNDKENKDVYMVALRNEKGALIGYYEKHEYRDRETMKLYDLGE